MFLGLVLLFNRHLWREVAIAGMFSVWLSLFRLLPAGIAFTGFNVSYASGFPTLNTFLDALTTIKAFQYEHIRTAIYDVGWHEHDVFIGYLGVAFVAFFGIYHRFSKNPHVQNLSFRAFDFPILLVVLFSFGFWFDILSDLQIPLVSWAERVPSRFFIIPLLMLAVISSVRMQALLHLIRDNMIAKVLLLAGIVQLAHSLAAHSWFWRTIDDPGFEEGPGPEFIINASEHSDLLYTTVVNVSGILTIAGLIILCGLLVWSVRRRHA